MKIKVYQFVKNNPLWGFHGVECFILSIKSQVTHHYQILWQGWGYISEKIPYTDLHGRLKTRSFLLNGKPSHLMEILSCSPL